VGLSLTVICRPDVDQNDGTNWSTWAGGSKVSNFPPGLRESAQEPRKYQASWNHLVSLVLFDESPDRYELENYVSLVLRQEGVVPPLIWSNWWKETQWGRFHLIMIVSPSMRVLLLSKRESAVWLVAFYLISGVGK